jgi:hypothetical protein
MNDYCSAVLERGKSDEVAPGLADIRHEQASSLERKGFVVRVSKANRFKICALMHERTRFGVRLSSTRLPGLYRCLISACLPVCQQ